MICPMAKWDVVDLFACCRFSGKGRGSENFWVFRTSISKCGRNLTFPENVEKCLNRILKNWEFILFLVYSKSFKKLSRHWLDI